MPLPIPGPGRRSLWTQEVEDEILDRLAAGETLTSICETPRLPDFPAMSSVVRWGREDNPPGFSARYQHAGEVGAMVQADRIPEEIEALALKDAAAAAVVLKARSWYLGVMVPARYGKALNVNARVAGGVDPVTWGVAEVPVATTPPAEDQEKP